MATSPLPNKGSPKFKAGDKIRSGPQVGLAAISPLPSRGSPRLHSGGEVQNKPASGQMGYITPAALLFGGSQMVQSGGRKTKSSPQVALVTASDVPFEASHTLQSKGTT